MGSRKDGVHSLDDIMGRCVIDRELGCWVWRGATIASPSGRGRPGTRVWLSESPDGSGPAVMTATRAAWLLAGKPLDPGHVVWRARPHCRHGCINPAHGGAGTRRQMFEAFTATGQLRGDPQRALVNAKNRRRQVLPRDLVVKAEELFAQGWMQKDVAAWLRIGHDTARKIRLGVHPNSTASQRVLRGASVFSLGAP